MPYIIIDIINNKPFQIKIIPLNEKINKNIMMRVPRTVNWRSVYLNHVVLEPKLSIMEWSDNVDVALMNRIFDSIKAYIKYIDSESIKLRTLNYRIDVLSDELDSLIEYSLYNNSEEVENRIDLIEDKLNDFRDKREVVSKEVNDIKCDRKSFDVRNK